MHILTQASTATPNEETRVPTAPTTTATVYGTTSHPDGYTVVSDRPLLLVGAIDGQEMRLQERQGAYWLICHARGICDPVPLSTLLGVLRKYTRNPDTAAELQTAADTYREAEVSA